MRRLHSIFRRPALLAGLVPAALVLAVFGASLATGGFIFAQEEDTTPTATAGDEAQTPAADEENATATPSAGEDADDATPANEDTLRDQFLDSLADQLGVSREQLDRAISDSALALVDQAVADGRITEEEAEYIRERIAAGEFPFFGFRGHHRGVGCGLFGVDLEETAEFLGLTMTELRDALADGQSLAQVAEAQGSSRDELRSFMLAEVEERLDQAVENDTITQERADERLQRAGERIDELIDREGLPLRPFKLDPEAGPEGATEAALPFL